jgi:photosystem II stability/assembly factor-like uncharacterized protein
MKFLPELVCLALLLPEATSADAQGTWERVMVPTDQSLNSVFFTDSLYGWIAGDSGTMIHTQDGGKTWNSQDTRTNNNIVSVFFLNRNLGWASSLNYSTVPYGTLLLKTTNGGAEWTGVPYPADDIFITCILFRDSLNGWMGGRPHALVKTTDGGGTWMQANIDTSVLAFFPVLEISFYNDQYGYACGGMFDIAGVIWRTSDGGELWHAMDPSEAPADEVHQLHIFDSLHVLGAGGDPDFGYGVGMIRTSDGGVSWNYQELGMQGAAYDMDFRTRKEAWAPLGIQRKLIFSTDTGGSWTAVSTPDSTAIFRITFPDSLHGFAVGRSGAVIKYDPGTDGIGDPDPSGNTGDLVLHQNYPNPFRSGTRIRFTVPVTSGSRPVHIRIPVFTVFGTEISTIADQGFLPGDHEITWEGEDLQPGIYFYRLCAELPGHPGIFSVPKKMIRTR